MGWLALLRKLLKKIPWQVYACAGLLGMLAISNWLGYVRGEYAVQRKWDSAVARGTSIVDELKMTQGVVTTKVEKVYVDKVKVIHDKGETIIKEVPVYIPSNLPDLPASFRVFFDASATNTIPEATNISNAAPAPVTDVATTTAQNFTQYYEVKAQLEALQDWLDQQYRLYLEKCKQRGVHCSADSS
jgi:hypothetical protein